MAVTRNTYTGNGSTVLYSFTFPYLEATDIKVSVNGTTTTAYTLANATTIQFNTAPANGASIAIYRQTDDTALSAAFYPGSAIRSADLNDNFTQNLYVTQESNRDATDAIGYGQQAISTANGAVSTANAATATANTASSNASAAVATANTASSNASAAVSTANTASSNATSAVNTANAATATANSAAADAATAISTANSAVSTANSAVSTANSAVTTAGNAVTTANNAVSTATTASTNAANAVTTANAANSTSANALTTANNAVTTANGAVSTANAADTKADQAINAVANALLFDIVANVAAIPASPSNNDAVEITNSTGIESFTPLSGLPAGFVGDAGLSVRLLYQSAGSTWTWLQYFPNDPDNRYAGPNTDAGTAAAPSIAFGPTDPNTGIFSPGADEFGIATGGVGRFFIDAAGNVVVATALSVNGEDVVVDNDARLTDTRTPTDGSVTNAKVDANAAIAGTKISPDFGSQNVTTTGTTTAASFIPSSSTVPTNGVYLPAANSVAISTGGSGRLFVDASGNLLVGTSSSGSQSGTFGQSLRGNNPGLTFIGTEASGAIRTIYESAGNLIFWNGTGGTEIARFDSSGRLGIGTTSVDGAAKAAISKGGAEGFEFRVGDTAGVCEVVTYNRSGGAYTDLRYDSATHQFKIGGNEKARLDSSGRLLVGTSSTSSSVPKLIVSGGADGGDATAILLASKNTTPASSEALGVCDFSAANHSTAARIVVRRDGGTWTAGSSQPTRLEFSTTSDNSASPSERLRIASTGALGLSGANYGSSGQVLTSQGSGAAPQWAAAGGGLVLLSTINASAVNTVDFTSGFSSSYIDYFISIDNFSQNSGELHFFVSTDGGSTYVSSSVYRYAANTTSAPSIFGVGSNGQLKNTGFTSVNSDGTFRIAFYGAQATTRKLVVSDATLNHNGSITYARYVTSIDTTSVVNAFRIKAEGTNNITGTFRLFGVTKI